MGFVTQYLENVNLEQWTHVNQTSQQYDNMTRNGAEYFNELTTEQDSYQSYRCLNLLEKISKNGFLNEETNGPHIRLHIQTTPKIEWLKNSRGVDSTKSSIDFHTFIDKDSHFDNKVNLNTCQCTCKNLD